MILATSISTSGPPAPSYRWDWKPPTDPATGQPAYDAFPTPPFFAFSWVHGFVAIDAAPDHTNGLAASGSIASGGIPPDTVVSYNGVPGRAPAGFDTYFDSHHMLGGAVANPTTLPLWPSVQNSGTGVNGGDSATIEAMLSWYMGALTLGSVDANNEEAGLNPFGRPDLGDGLNQYVFDDQAAGQLNVPVMANAQWAGPDDMTWLTPQLDWGFFPAMLSQQVPTNKVTTADGNMGTLTVQSPGTNALNQPYPPSREIFIGLPVANDSLGNKNEFLQVNGANSQSAHIQVFYTGLATNHPNQAAAATPNWWYYYTQVVAPPDNSQWNANVGLDNYSHTVPQTLNISVHNDAYISDDGFYSYPMRIFHLSAAPGAMVGFCGLLHVQGVLRYVYLISHELGHRSVLQAGGISSRIGPAPQGAQDLDPAQPPLNFLGDGIWDGWELNHHLDPQKKDTTGAYGIQPNGDIGDEELLADVRAVNPVFTSIGEWMNDWADGGIQAGPSEFYSAYHPIDFKLYYEPMQYNQMTGGYDSVPLDNLPNHQLIYVKSVADIQAADQWLNDNVYNVLTDLP